MANPLWPSPDRQAAERLSWGVDYTDSGLVITTEDGRPMHPETLSGLFVRQAKRAGLPPIRLHDLRHSVASILLAQGVHPKVVSEQLGHATIALTLDTYSHIIPSLQQEATGVMATAILGSGSRRLNGGYGRTMAEPEAERSGRSRANSPLTWAVVVGRDGIEPPTLRFFSSPHPCRSLLDAAGAAPVRPAQPPNSSPPGPGRCRPLTGRAGTFRPTRRLNLRTGSDGQPR